MISAEQNDLITRVGPQAPAGKLLRRYWQPVALADELAGERPVRPVRLMGQNFVLFRDEQGQLGMLDRDCPHRGADLAFIVAGAPNILDQATACVRKRGEIGIVAMITENIPFYSYRIVFNEQTMFGAMTYATRDFKEAVDMVNNGLDLSDLVTQTMDLEHTQEGLDVLSRKQENVVKVMIEI